MTKHTMLQETPDSLPTSACMHLCSPDPHDPDRQHSDTNTVGTLRTIALFKLKLTEQSRSLTSPPRHKGSCPHEPMYAFQGTHTHNRGEKTATRTVSTDMEHTIHVARQEKDQTQLSNTHKAVDPHKHHAQHTTVHHCTIVSHWQAVHTQASTSQRMQYHALPSNKCYLNPPRGYGFLVYCSGSRPTYIRQCKIHTLHTQLAECSSVIASDISWSPMTPGSKNGQG